MRITGTLVAFCLALLCSLPATAQNKRQSVYIYGFASSFNDSTVYFTEVQQVDSAELEHKTKFLYNRSGYSNQLESYLESVGVPHTTCVTFFGTNRKAVETKYLKLRQRYLKNNRFNIKYIEKSQFAYTAERKNENE